MRTYLNQMLTLTVSTVSVLFCDRILMTMSGVSRLYFSMLARICTTYSLQSYSSRMLKYCSDWIQMLASCVPYRLHVSRMLA